jgi:hypothetical protein
MHRFAASIGSAAVGGLCGVLLAAFGNSISGSPLGSGVMIGLTVLAGGRLGRLPGAVLGGVCGMLLVALGSLVGGSIVGIVLTIVGCSLLGGWLRWAAQETPAEEENANPGEESSQKEFPHESGDLDTRIDLAWAHNPRPDVRLRVRLRQSVTR